MSNQTDRVTSGLKKIEEDEKGNTHFVSIYVAPKEHASLRA